MLSSFFFLGAGAACTGALVAFILSHRSYADIYLRGFFGDYFAWSLQDPGNADPEERGDENQIKKSQPQYRASITQITNGLMYTSRQQNVHQNQGEGASIRA